MRTAFIVIVLMMNAVRVIETSVYYNETTRRNIPEGSNVRMNLIEQDYFICKYFYRLLSTEKTVKIIIRVEISGPHCGEYKGDCPVGVVPCSLLEFNRRFRGPYCPDNRGSKHLWNVSQFLRDYTTQHPRNQTMFSVSSYYLWTLYLR
jgi:hypothetical protein